MTFLKLKEKNCLVLSFLNAAIFWLSFTALRFFLIYANGFGHYLDLTTQLKIFFYGGLEDLIFILPFLFGLILVSLFVGQKPITLFGFRFWYFFVCSLEFLFLAVSFSDILFFSLAGSHAHLWTFSFLFQASYFSDSVGGLLNLYGLLFFVFLSLIFFTINFYLIAGFKTGGNNKSRVITLGVIIVLFFTLIFINQNFTLNDILAEDLSNNLFVYIVSTMDYYHCVSPSLLKTIDGLEPAEISDQYVRSNSAGNNYLYLDNGYPLVKASPHNYCLLNPDWAECQNDNDGDGYSLAQDCDDQNQGIHPGAAEKLNNGIDENCNGIDDAKPNVILIVLESFGAEYTALSESFDPKITPNFNAALLQGLAFKNFYSNGVDTISSIVSSLCSINPYPDPASYQIYKSDLNLLCLPAILKQFSYQTIEMQAGDLEFLDKPTLFKKIGFTEAIGKKEFGSNDETKWGISDRQLFSEVAKKLDNQNQSPFFLTIYTIAGHYPFDLPADGTANNYVEDESINKILNVLHYSDEALGQFLNENKNKDWFKNSLIIITADNGLPTGQIRVFDKGNFNHVFEENVWIPLLILGRPDRPGSTETVGSHVDLAPTILDLLGVDVINNFIGRSLLGPMPDYKNSVAYFTSKFGKCMMGVRQGDYKLITNLRKTSQFLYNLTADRQETKTLDQTNPDLAEGLKTLIFRNYLATMYLFSHNNFWSPQYQQLMEQTIDLNKSRTFP